MSKPILYVDIDDTLIAQCHLGSGFDMRPGVFTQLRILSRLFKCTWLTCWDRPRITEMVRLLYGIQINKEFLYADWGHGHPQRKAGYVLNPTRAQKDWWWIEDPLSPEEIKAITEAGKLDRYIPVEPQGYWGFLNGVNELFRRANITDNDLKRVGANPKWFDREAISQNIK